MDHKLEFLLEDALRMHFYASLDGAPMPPFVYPHHIENEIELFILVEGDISFSVESRVYKLSSGDVILTKPNEMHHLFATAKPSTVTIASISTRRAQVYFRIL